MDRFLRRQAAVPEPAMRRALWREFFEASPAEEALEAVARTLDGMATREAWARLAYQALLDLIDTLRGREFPPRRALYEAARLAEREDVCRLLLMAPRAREATPAELRVDLTDGDRELTLGERRSLARTRDRALLLRLIADPDPGVIANVLGNPFLTEPDVVRLASRRPVSGESLRAVFRHDRWGRAPEVLRALIYNPYTPTDIALGLLPLLEAPLLRAVARETSVAAVVRDRARALIGEPAGSEPTRDP